MAIPIMPISPLQLFRLRRAARLLGLRVAIAGAVLFLAQDKLILRPGIEDGGGQVAVTRPGWATDWTERGEFRGKVYADREDVAGTVLVFHGNAGTIAGRETLAQNFTSRGFRVVLMEYPGFGRRDGWATITGAKAAALADFVLAKQKWPGPLYVVGESFGAGIAAQVAGANPEAVSGALLFTPWDSLKNVVDGKFWGVPVGLLLRDKLDSTAALSSFPGHLVVVAAGADNLIPANHAKALASAAPAAIYRELAGAGHNDWPMHLTRADWDVLTSGMVGATRQKQTAQMSSGTTSSGLEATGG